MSPLNPAEVRGVLQKKKSQKYIFYPGQWRLIKF